MEETKMFRDNDNPQIVEMNERNNSAGPTKRKKKLKIDECLQEYTSKTSLHGIQYLGDEDGSVFQRVLWSLMFLMSLSFCSYLIHNLWVKWDTSPVIVSFSETETPIWTIPFPAITVCPITRIPKSYPFSVKCLKDEYTPEEIIECNMLSQVCTGEGYNLSTIPKLNFLNESAMATLLEIAPKLDDVLIECERNGVENCTNYVSSIFTEKGLCFTLNMLSSDEIFREDTVNKKYFNNERKSEEWSLSGGYKNSPVRTYPIRALGIGDTSGVLLTLSWMEYENNPKCSGPKNGFTVSLHSPNTFPRVSQSYFPVRPGQEITATVTPTMMTTSNELKSYKPEKRQCYFPDEKRLRFFKEYTQEHCQLECLSNYTLALCNCVPFGFIRNETTNICAMNMAGCPIQAIAEYFSEAITLDAFDESHLDKDSEVRLKVLSECKCLSACTSIEYEAVTSQNKMNWNYLATDEEKEAMEEAGVKPTQVNIFFKQPQFISSKRSELYGVVDFMANCGGLLGLCCGFSVLSLVEIFYFCFLRIFRGKKRTQL